MIVTVASEGGGGGGNSIFTGAGAGGGIGRGALLKSTSVTRLFATMLASPAFRKMSLQLSLQNAKLREAQAAYFDALRSAGESADDIVGYGFCHQR
jgi:hypothetical protein